MTARGPLPDEADHETLVLRSELEASRQHLEQLVAEKDIAVEELRAANEEVQSSNEELQSINEELETRQRGAAVANEELRTVNEELESRNSQLSRANEIYEPVKRCAPADHHGRSRASPAPCDRPGRALIAVTRQTSAGPSPTFACALPCPIWPRC